MCASLTKMRCACKLIRALLKRQVQAHSFTYVRLRKRQMQAHSFTYVRPEPYVRPEHFGMCRVINRKGPQIFEGLKILNGSGVLVRAFHVNLS